ncbi:hypothetical protein GCM10022215_13890 [Nocardioides fonticola]|uniref:Uncharacterized protein n=1 Tax=Nocardioides fonticola TaxID=450363 RepID=A0ABP7XG14_9ACTN
MLSQMGDQPSGSVTRVPAALILAISAGVNMLKNESAIANTFRSRRRRAPGRILPNRVVRVKTGVRDGAAPSS